MRKLNVVSTVLIIVLLSSMEYSILSAQTVDMKNEYSKVLVELTDALMKRQIVEATHSYFGAISCEHCNVYHTRAAEAVYPFSVMYKISKDEKYFNSAIILGNWLIKQQEQNGSWKETPEEWTGTTTDQLLMMMLSYNIISEKISKEEQRVWKSAMEEAADYLTAVMSPEFASINYVATTTATLAMAFHMFKKEQYATKARELAHRTISKMDEDKFINGEGGKSYLNKSGVDLGYNMEMSLWGLGYYAKLMKDSLVNNEVKIALKNHLYFIYPDGSMDGSWGIRSNKWTTYGGATSDGCQVLFSLFADEDPRYATASYKNLQFLKTNMNNGIVGYGPHHWEIFETQPCIYPTFAKAKNLAFAYELESKKTRTLAKLPTEEIGWIKYFKTLDVVEVRTANFMATITAYGYEDMARAKSKYMHRPSGGAISNLWVKDHGYLQASSVTMYQRPEPMHFPEAPGIKSLTPRIEFTDTAEYFTNLYEFNATLEIHYIKSTGKEFRVSAIGEMKEKNWLMGGVRYKYDYEFTDNRLIKTVTLQYHDAKPIIRIIEPIIQYSGMTFDKINSTTVMISTKTKKIKFELINGSAELFVGKDKEKYWAPYPALKAYPIDLVILPPNDGFIQRISYSLTILENKKEMNE